MKIYTVSDLHLDYRENREWLFNISKKIYKNDILILAGDICDSNSIIKKTFEHLAECFYMVFFVPGNHDLWVRENEDINSIDKFNEIRLMAAYSGIIMETHHFDRLSIVPLYGWYDFSFGEINENLKNVWNDFDYCRWPEGYEDDEIMDLFVSMYDLPIIPEGNEVVSFSHFLPAIEIMPSYIPEKYRFIYPVLGSCLLENQIKKLGSNIHIYGHSHVNVRKHYNNVLYINNAFGYPKETYLKKELLFVKNI